jgi:hypothetical protein
MKREATMKSKGEGSEGMMMQERSGKPLIKQNDHVKHGEWIKSAWTSSNLA